MVSSQPKSRYTVETYLEIERKSEERHEYLDGEVYLMAGESPEHGTICMNLSVIMGSQLRGTPCQAFAKDMKVRSGPTPQSGTSMKGLFSYPDLLVACGDLQFHDQFRDILLNPTLIVEANRWELVSIEGLEASLHLKSLNCTLPLVDVYDRIVFPPEEPELV